MGLDDVTLQTVYTLHVYSAEQIRFGEHFADTIKPLSNGDLLLDMTQFDVLVPDERASVRA